MAKAINQAKLDRLRREWQKRLKLQDWHIISKFVPNAEWREGMEDAVGFNDILLDAKESKISILHPNEMDGERLERSEDIENTVVHELLHCHFQPFFEDSEPMRTLQEQTIEVITGALLELKRGKR